MASEVTEPTEPAGPARPAEVAAPPASVTAAPVIPTTHWTDEQEDEEEEYVGDGDSALGDDAASTTASLSASILEYRTFHGRTYHSLQGTADHWTPNDDAHLESMDCVTPPPPPLPFPLFPLPPSPISRPGTTLLRHTRAFFFSLCSDFADAHPKAEVIGTDISPSQPEWVPPNLKFEIEDCTQPWTYPADAFDFIHLRYLFGAISDWGALHAQAFRACRPGGWVEVVEPSVQVRSDDGSVRKGTAFYDWGLLFHEASSKYGRSMRIVDDGIIPGSLRDAGFVDVHSRRFKMPATPWPRDPELRQLGAFCRLAMEQDLDGYAMYLFTNALNWSREQVTIFLAGVRKEMNDKQMQPYFVVEVTYGRKPEGPSTAATAAAAAGNDG
ncbi:putative mRNA 3 -end-processing protein YTH1 [Rosellinia necatrix]|uniref:Putative mRNA 3-end-processing protein YTH1 n=1 Tax=Rosellinia necatrix TaxID=77044 RepID=A0A1W2TIR6_ROSNE|nr:putative mRNA 3 -end-processing protein YTH1 [Rosellinia necatrix]